MRREIKNMEELPEKAREIFEQYKRTMVRDAIPIYFEEDRGLEYLTIMDGRNRTHVLTINTETGEYYSSIEE